MQNDRINFLLSNLQESLDVEVKNWLGGLRDNTGRSKLAKEIIALANNGGGFLFVGFEEDAEGHPEITPQAGDQDGYTQDSIADLVEKYCEPACQCEIGYFAMQGSAIRHPVIEVPGKHRTPIYAKSGGPNDLGDQRLTSGIVYVRRPGGHSEPARTQDDWEKLLERLVRARQADLLDSIRQILEPRSSLTITQNQPLDIWESESYDAWKGLLDVLPADSPHRLNKGHWIFAFQLHPFHSPSLTVLKDFLDHKMPQFTGWPPFVNLHRDRVRPKAAGNVVQAWLVDTADLSSDPTFSSFWRVSRDGFGFVLNPMTEDREDYEEHIVARIKKIPPPYFNWKYLLWTSCELLLSLHSLAHEFSGKDAKFYATLNCQGTKGRHIVNTDWNYSFRSGGECILPSLKSRIESTTDTIEPNLAELVYQLSAPIIEQYEFSELKKATSDAVVKEWLSSRQR